MNKISYSSPVVLEVVFEIRFGDSSHWSPATSFAFVKGAAAKGYTELEEKPSGLQFNLSIGDTIASQSVRPTSSRIQCWEPERFGVLQAAADIVAINRRKPYLGWQKFLPQILFGIKLYKNSSTNLPSPSFFQLTYVNEFEIDVNNTPWDYLLSVSEPVIYAGTITQLVTQTNQLYDDGCSIEAQTFVTPKVSAGIAGADSTASDKLLIGFVLKYTGKSIDIKDLQSGKRTIELAHRRVQEAFEATITDALREKMGK